MDAAMLEARLLAENAERERQILREAICGHPSELVTLLVMTGSYFDDTITEQGYCRDCHAWLSRTHWRISGETEDRMLTALEIQRLQDREDRYRVADAT